MSRANLDQSAREQAEQRLRTATIGWITTVRPDGQPQSSPVGIAWDGALVLVLSQPGAPKVANLRTNPRVALHLELDETAGDGGVVTIEGSADLDDGPVRGRERATYLDRHLDTIRAEGLDPDEALAEFSTVIRITPTRVRTY